VQANDALDQGTIKVKDAVGNLRGGGGGCCHGREKNWLVWLLLRGLARAQCVLFLAILGYMSSSSSTGRGLRMAS
jgi:hypothetical protein